MSATWNCKVHFSSPQIAVKAKEMPKLDVMMIDPSSPPGAAPEKVALFKVPLENV